MHLLMMHTTVEKPHSVIDMGSFSPSDGTHFSLFFSSYQEQYKMMKCTSFVSPGSSQFWCQTWFAQMWMESETTYWKDKWLSLCLYLSGLVKWKFACSTVFLCHTVNDTLCSLTLWPLTLSFISHHFPSHLLSCYFHFSFIALPSLFSRWVSGDARCRTI